jgi:hypothetical protein
MTPPEPARLPVPDVDYRGSTAWRDWMTATEQNFPAAEPPSNKTSKVTKKNKNQYGQHQ